ncbi:MAG TPA: FAD-binding oxidoreductase [Homoserinimonas sp.]|nr:FAD-binding oxidoreductase [Homoserinimonas sp.]
MTVNTLSFETLKRSIAGTALLPEDEGYLAASTVAVATGSPVLVVLPKTAADVSTAVTFARAENLPLSVRSGGHSGAGHGTNTGGVVINLSSMNSVVVEPSGLVSIGGGAVWGDIAAALAGHGLALTSGDTVSVGVGGLTLGGGIGWMVRKHGLALDSLVAAEVVTASGDIVTADQNTHADLFWAIRGGGGNFGIVTRFTFLAQPLDRIVGGSISFGMDALETTLAGWRDAMRSAPEELTTTLVAMPDFGPFPAGVQLLVCYAGDDEQAAAEAFEPLLGLPGMLSHDLKLKNNAEMLEEAHPPAGPLVIVDNNAFSPELSDAAIADLAAYFRSLDTSVLMIRSLGGAFSRVPADATAFAHRDSEALVMSVAFLPEGSGAGAVRDVQDRWATLAPYLSGTYANFRTSTDEAVVAQMYPPETRERLTAIKGQYDPENLFARNLNIRPVSN